VLVRTWNLFHGNTVPPGRRAYLREMVDLVTVDRPDVVCLQEVPAWALPRLGSWAQMQAVTALTMRPVVGRVPIRPGIGRTLTSVNHGLFRSAFSGQGNATLLAPGLKLGAAQAVELNSRSFCMAQAAALGLDAVAVRAWRANRRFVQLVPATLPDGRRMVIANMHCSGSLTDPRIPDAEIAEAARLLDDAVPEGAAAILAGDFNISISDSEVMRRLTSQEGGFSEPSPGIDHVLVRRAPTGPARVWEDQEREYGGRFLSDHAPVEVEIDL
jgi:endonuclease/exonuclease/phosphatase family metal-dependent hydrolase